MHDAMISRLIACYGFNLNSLYLAKAVSTCMKGKLMVILHEGEGIGYKFE